MIDKVQIEATLRQLGDDSDAVAASLREQGVKGRPGLSQQCPIARLLCQRYLVDEIEVEWDEIRCRNAGDDESTWIDPPPAVGSFIVYFDGGRYPDLIWAAS